jgi:predicted transcriptional regulator
LLSRKEKEKLVVRLAQEGKTTREIAKEVHISLKDIGNIIRKHSGDEDNDQDQDQVKKPTLESRAFKMFKEGKSNVDVAIYLNLPAQDVLSLYQDFQSLSNLDEFSSIYTELSNDLRFFIELYYRLKEEGLITTRDILNLARSGVQLRDLGITINELYDEIGRLNITRMDLRDKMAMMQRL